MSANPEAEASRRCGAMSDLAADILASRAARARHAIRSRHRARHAPGVTHGTARTTRIVARTIGSDSNARRSPPSTRFTSFRVGERVGRPSRNTIVLANRCIDASLFRRTRATVRTMRAWSGTRIARWSRVRCDATPKRASHVVQLQCLHSRATNVCSARGAATKPRCDRAKPMFMRVSRRSSGLRRRFERRCAMAMERSIALRERDRKSVDARRDAAHRDPPSSIAMELRWRGESRDQHVCRWCWHRGVCAE